MSKLELVTLDELRWRYPKHIISRAWSYYTMTAFCQATHGDPHIVNDELFIFTSNDLPCKKCVNAFRNKDVTVFGKAPIEAVYGRRQPQMRFSPEKLTLPFSSDKLSLVFQLQKIFKKRGMTIEQFITCIKYLWTRSDVADFCQANNLVEIITAAHSRRKSSACQKCKQSRVLYYNESNRVVDVFFCAGCANYIEIPGNLFDTIDELTGSEYDNLLRDYFMIEARLYDQLIVGGGDNVLSLGRNKPKSSFGKVVRQRSFTRSLKK